jgi:transposase
MVRPDFEKWQQTAEEIRRLAIKAEHVRSRERFQALYMIGSGQTNASEWAATIDRQKQTVLGWVHQYNAKGAESLHYRASGGRQAKLSEVEKKDHCHGRTRATSGASDTGLRLDVEKITTLGRRKTTTPNQPHDLKNVLETSRLQLEKE